MMDVFPWTCSERLEVGLPLHIDSPPRNWRTLFGDIPPPFLGLSAALLDAASSKDIGETLATS